MRNEYDSIGCLAINEDAVYGIHSLRAVNNFIKSGERINAWLIKAYLQVKLAAAESNFKSGIIDYQKYNLIEEAIGILLEETEEAIGLKSFSIYNKVIVDPYQGGAGTSLNMNVNEIIANTALNLGGYKYGDYNFIHPLDHVNLSQSTNDTYPTAFKIAAIYLLRELTSSFASLQNALQKKENEFAGILKLGRTEYQDAVPITLGQEFGAYAQAIARNRWRLYNCEERLRSVNLGGTAVGNSVAADKHYVLSVNSELNKITGLPIAKAEDLIDATQNLDVFVEAHGLVKAGAVTIIKICNDLRFLSSGPKGGIGEIILPSLQAGSSIMPGKVNPVIPEHAIQIAELVKGYDVIISNLAGAGHLELNAFMPAISHLFLKSVEYLKNANYILAEKCISGIEADKERCSANLLNSSAPAAALINEFGYDNIAEIVKKSAEKKISFAEELKTRNLVSGDELMNLISKGMRLNGEFIPDITHASPMRAEYAEKNNE